MVQVLVISLWAHLFCGAWSEPGKVFGWFKKLAYLGLPYWIRHPLVECGTCHAVWIAVVWQAVNIANGGTFDSGNILAIMGASFLALLLDDFAQIREKWKNN